MAKKKQPHRSTQDTEERIIEAASRVFSQDGYRGATTKRIAEAAGVNEITLFRRFKSKENLLRRVLENKGSAIQEVMDRSLIMEEGADVVDCLRNLSALASGPLIGEWELIMPLMEQRNIRPLIAEFMFSAVRSLTARLNRFFKFHAEAGNIRRIDPEVATAIFFGYIASPVNRPRLMGMGRSQGKGEKTFDEFIDIFMGGISK